MDLFFLNSKQQTQMKKILFFLMVLSARFSFAQNDIVDDILNEQKPKREYVAYTFKSTRIINGHSIEMVKKNAIDVRISHRFGDIAVKGVSGHTLGGIDNASDILISVEYGILDDLSIGVGRTKGGSANVGAKELYNGYIKYRALKQTTDFKYPMSITFVANAVISSQKFDPFVSTQLMTKEPIAHRASYMLQGLFACKATPWLSLQLSPTFIWRNYVPYNDVNGMFFLGFSGRAKVAKRTAIIFEYFTALGTMGNRQYGGFVRGKKGLGYYPNLHVGVEFETGGHVFAVNLTNSEGLIENDFLPYNTKTWSAGQIRLGFTISRIFQLGKGSKKAKK
jgi:hypothetical protein